ncbi:MAG TPA: hypothetical protein VJG32_13885 [Anaerolineae bacterium]|nr:hypothetical protein [Anaerolineae bacterium]
MTTSRLTPEYGEINWDWSEGQGGGRASFHTNSPDQTVYAVSPDFPTSFELRDVIQAYGDPSHVLAAAGHGPDFGSGISYDLWIVDQSQGFAVRTGGHSKPVLGADMLLNDVVFFDPADMGFISPSEWLVPWQGIRDFEFYCHDEESGRACHSEN